MENVEKVCRFLDEAQTYYLATVEGDQPRVRPFGTALVYNDLHNIRSLTIQRNTNSQNNVGVHAFTPIHLG